MPNFWHFVRKNFVLYGTSSLKVSKVDFMLYLLVIPLCIICHPSTAKDIQRFREAVIVKQTRVDGEDAH